MKIFEVISKLSAFHPPVNEERTCDGIKFGDPEQECTGVAVTVYTSPEVIRKAAELNANLIICHEPLFYTHEELKDWLAGNTVYEEKAALLEQHNMVVWRDHDRMHGGSPMRLNREYTDMIFQGIMKELGWEQYCVGFDKKPLLYEIPETTVRALAAELLEKFGLSGARIVGNPEGKVRKVFICEHVTASNHGGKLPDCAAIKEIEDGDYDVMIPLEIVDWTLSAYVRDAAQFGRDKAIIEMGHFNVEELAMKHMIRWLPPLLGEGTPVHYVQSGDSFTYFMKE